MTEPNMLVLSTMDVDLELILSEVVSEADAVPGSESNTGLIPPPNEDNATKDHQGLLFGADSSQQALLALASLFAVEHGVVPATVFSDSQQQLFFNARAGGASTNRQEEGCGDGITVDSSAAVDRSATHTGTEIDEQQPTFQPRARRRAAPPTRKSPPNPRASDLSENREAPAVPHRGVSDQHQTVPSNAEEREPNSGDILDHSPLSAGRTSVAGFEDSVDLVPSAPQPSRDWSSQNEDVTSKSSINARKPKAQNKRKSQPVARANRDSSASEKKQTLRLGVRIEDSDRPFPIPFTYEFVRSLSEDEYKAWVGDNIIKAYVPLARKWRKIPEDSPERPPTPFLTPFTPASVNRKVVHEDGWIEHKKQFPPELRSLAGALRNRLANTEISVEGRERRAKARAEMEEELAHLRGMVSESREMKEKISRLEKHAMSLESLLAATGREKEYWRGLARSLLLPQFLPQAEAEAHTAYMGFVQAQQFSQS